MPYHNSNRIPVTVVDALVPDLSSLSEKKSPRSMEFDVDPLVVAVRLVRLLAHSRPLSVSC